MNLPTLRYMTLQSLRQFEQIQGMYHNSHVRVRVLACLFPTTLTGCWFCHLLSTVPITFTTSSALLTVNLRGWLPSTRRTVILSFSSQYTCMCAHSLWHKTSLVETVRGKPRSAAWLRERGRFHAGSRSRYAITRLARSSEVSQNGHCSAYTVRVAFKTFTSTCT